MMQLLFKIYKMHALVHHSKLQFIKISLKSHDFSELPRTHKTRSPCSEAILDHLMKRYSKHTRPDQHWDADGLSNCGRFWRQKKERTRKKSGKLPKWKVGRRRWWRNSVPNRKANDFSGTPTFRLEAYFLLSKASVLEITCSTGWGTRRKNRGINDEIFAR